MLKKILIADDDQGIVDAIEMMLSFYGYEVKWTHNGHDVLQLKPDDYPDLILLDIWMSGVDGRDICRALKANNQMSHIPVLMISASREVRQSALNAGADNFIAKPFDMEDMIFKIEDLLNRQFSSVAV